MTLAFPLSCLAATLLALAAHAGTLRAPAEGTLRVAAYDVDLTRGGPGLLLYDLGRDPDPALAAVLQVIRTVRPDVLLLARFDHDLRGRALDAFRALLREGTEGIDYPYAFAAPVNAGVPSGLDLDDDGRTAGPGDAYGWGRFPGNGGLAILSRLPIDAGAARSFAALPWTGLPGADLPTRPDGSPFPDPPRQAALRLSSRAHWDVPVVLADGRHLHLLASNPTPPLFDGAEGLNRRRNADEIRFWSAYLEGIPFADDEGAVTAAPTGPLVLLGNLNLDPFDGHGEHTAIARLLAHPRLQDPRPASDGGAAAGREGVNTTQRGDAALDTADWREDGPGNLRVDYVLPASDLRVTDAGVFWPAPGAPFADVVTATPHRLVWVDLQP